MSGRILIVDDDASLRESLALVLAAEGYEVVCAADAG
jgi:DNA-binding response OmpR family regulator